MTTLFLIVMAISICADSISQVCFRHGMQQQGELQALALPGFSLFIWQALKNPFIIGGTVLAAVSYFCYLSALSLKDLTVAFPVVAIEYAIVPALAVLVLKEQVPVERWLGIGLVVVGVVLIGRSQAS